MVNKFIITLQYDTTVDQLKIIRNEIEGYINNSDDYNTKVGVAVRIDKFSDSSIDMYVRCFAKKLKARMKCFQWKKDLQLKLNDCWK